MTGNDLKELKQHVIVHARGQNLPEAHYQEILSRIQTDEEGPGSWVGEWTRAGERLESDGRLLDACRHYTMARFPFVDGPARREALGRCVSVFDRWRRDVPGIERIDLELPEGRVRCWASGLSRTERRPLLIVMGGIVTPKEQWAPVLARGVRLGMAGIVLELPGVGENTLRYDAQSWRMLSALLDQVCDRADVTRTYALALSFSGHLALRCAYADRRIRGVVTAGAPISDFFTDEEWRRGVPRITIDTLAHLTGTEPEKVGGELADWALSGDVLSGIDIPVGYAASRRDEIIPAGELAHLRRHVRKLRIVEKDDVHGSPRHVSEVGVWAILSILRMQGARTPPRAVLESSLLALRARRRLLNSPR